MRFKKVLKWAGVGFVGFIALVVIIAVFQSESPEDDGVPPSSSELADTPTPTNTIASPPTDTPTSASAPTTSAGPATTTPTPTLTPVPVAQIPTATPPATSDCAEPETPGLSSLVRKLQSCKPNLSPFTKDTIKLYLDLQEFRGDPEFHQVGFGLCCRFNLWKQEVDALTDRAGSETVREIGIVPGELFSLGWEYLQNQGHSTDLADHIEASFRAAVMKTMGIGTSRPTTTVDVVPEVQVIGEWENEYGGLQSRIKLINEFGVVKLEQTFRDGSTMTESLVEGESDIGRRFDATKGPGEYFVIDLMGNLEIWDSYGLISTARKIEMDVYMLSDSGVKVWRTPDAHPLLRHTDTTHPWFLDKLAEIYSRGKVRGLPRILSENSEDARTWHYFSPLLADGEERTQVLEGLLTQSFPEGAISPQLLAAIPSAELILWPKLYPPPSRPQKEGPSEPDILIRLGDHGLVIVEAKYQSPVSERTTYDETRDQVIRLIDVGSWQAKQENLRDQDAGHQNSYVIVLQYGDADTNAQEVVDRYRQKPQVIKRALPYRSDLADADYRRLACSVAFIRWPDPFSF